MARATIENYSDFSRFLLVIHSMMWNVPSLGSFDFVCWYSLGVAALQNLPHESLVAFLMFGFLLELPEKAQYSLCSCLSVVGHFWGAGAER